VAITVDPVNDAPVITLSGSAPSFTENGPSVAVDDALTVTDIDDTSLVSGNVSITAGLVAGDTLTFTPAGGITDADAAPGVLALSGTTTVANWQTTLRSVQFGTTSDNPTNATRTVSFTVNDGDISSATVTKDVTVVPVNDAPVLTQPDATTLTYNENAAPTVVAPNITATDVDSTNLVGATIDIGIGFASGQDVLTLGTNPQNGISATYDAATGTLTLSGTSTVANYQAALRDVRYSNNSDDPSSATRTISFQVDDGPGPNDLSNTVSRDVTVSPVNDPPIAPPHTYAATANMAVDIPAATGLLTGATDLEAGTTLTVGTISATTPAGGSITNVNNATGAFQFNPPPGVTGPVTFTYTVCDNGNPAPSQCSAPATVTVNVAGPVIWFVNGSAAAGGTGRLTDPFQTITAASTAIGANTDQRVFIYAGNYTQGITLNSGGWLVGQQVTGASFDAVMGITPAAGTIGRPTIATGTAAIGNTVTLNTNAVLRGIAINSGVNTAVTGSGGLTGVDVTQTTTNTTSGTALSLNNVAGTLSFSNVFKSSGTGVGISLTNVAANVTVLAGGIPGSPAAVDIDGGTGSFSTAGTVSSATGRPVEVTNRNTGSPGLVQFTGAVTGNGTSTGILLDNNDTSTVSFTAGLLLNTGANPAFTATNGGTVTVTDPNPPNFAPNNTITTTTGTALNVTGTTIGAAGLNFLSISANGAANGIVLDTTGTLGGLVVSGDGGGANNGSGGTIQNTTGAGISLNNTRNVSIGYLNVTNPGTDGIRITDIDGFTLNRSTISDSTGTAPADKAIDLGDFVTGTPVDGAITIANNVIGPASGSAPHDSLAIGISSGTSTWSVTGTTFRNTGNSAISLELRGTSTVTSFTVSGSTFAGAGPLTSARGIFANTLDDSVMTMFTIQNNVFTNNNIHIDLNQQNDTDPVGSHTFQVLNNTTMTGARSHAMNVFAAAGTFGGTFTGTIQGNVIGTAGVANSGSEIGNGIRVNINGGSDSTMLLNNNVVRQTPNGRGLEIIARNGTGGLDITVTSNDVNPQAVSFPLAAILVQSNCLTTCNTLRADVRSNTVPAGTDVTDLLTTYIAVVESSTSTLELVDTTTPISGTCATELAATNTGSTGVLGACSLIAGPISTP
jgi:hypothetical protein